MVLDAAAWQALVIGEVGDIDAATGDLLPSGTPGLLASQSATLWDAAAPPAEGDLLVQALGFKLRCLNLVIGQLSDLVPESAEGVVIQQQARVRTLQAERDAVLKELERTAVTTSVMSGELVTTAPQVAPWQPLRPSVPPDANDPRFSGGSPYARRRWWGF